MNRLKRLQIEHLDQKFQQIGQFPILPAEGWIRAVRSAMNMSLVQLANKMGLTSPTLLAMERREVSGAITLKNLRRAAEALNMKLVYGFLPMDETLEKTIEKQALIVAQKIVERTNRTMKLEDQQVSKERLDKSVKELAEEIRNEMPKYLWD